MAAGDLTQAQIRPVRVEEQSVLRPPREHAVGFVGASGNQVVDEHARVGLVALQHEGFAAEQFFRRIDSRQQALDRRLLVAGGAIDLPRAE